MGFYIYSLFILFSQIWASVTASIDFSSLDSGFHRMSYSSVSWHLQILFSGCHWFLRHILEVHSQ